jgi:glutamyl-tRNA reductase
MEILVTGLSHKTAPVELRERLALPPDQVGPALTRFVAAPAVREAVFLSTCNRVELYVAAEDVAAAADRSREALEEGAKSELLPYLYTFVGVDAARHLFRVASSLDSLVLGEPQILGQVKDAFSLAVEAGTTGPILSRCFHRAFQVAKRVRTDTGIARTAVSMSAVAVDLVKTIFDDLRDKRVLLIGAGEMAELAARHLSSAGVSEILVVNRSRERAERVAEAVGGRAHALEAKDELLEIADIVISSTASPTFAIGLDDAKRVVKRRKYRPLLLVDLAVPRDIDPRVGDLDNLYLYDVDDLVRVANDHRASRQEEAAQAELIVSTESVALAHWMRSLAVVPTLTALRTKLSEIARTEVDRTVSSTPALEEAQREALDRLAEAIVNKVLHTPTTALRREAMSGGTDLAATVQRLFDLEVTEAPAAGSETEPAGNNPGSRIEEAS